MALSHEVFDETFCEFRIKFTGDGIIFVQKYTIGNYQISVYTASNSVDFNAKGALHYLNSMYKKYFINEKWQPFFLSVVKSFDNEHGNFQYRFLSQNPEEKRLYENFCSLAIS